MSDVLVALAVGLAGGALAGILGVGGGAIFIPALVLLLDTDQIVAQGVSLCVIVITAAVAGARHVRNGTVDFAVARWIVGPSIGLSIAGAFLAHRLDDEILRRIFAGVVLAVALRVLLSILWSRAAGPKATPAPTPPHDGTMDPDSSLPT